MAYMDMTYIWEINFHLFYCIFDDFIKLYLSNIDYIYIYMN